MSPELLPDKIRKLQEELEEIQNLLTADRVPLPILEDFKRAVDHARSTVWIALSAALSGQQTDVLRALMHFRLQRVGEMCRQLLTDVGTGVLAPDSAECQELVAALRETCRRLEAAGAARVPREVPVDDVEELR